MVIPNDLTLKRLRPYYQIHPHTSSHVNTTDNPLIDNKTKEDGIQKQQYPHWEALNSPWLHPISLKSGEYFTLKPSTSWKPSTSTQRKNTPQKGLETFQNDVQRWRSPGPTDPHPEWHHHPGEPGDPQHVLDAITTTIKSEQHCWHFWDKLLLDVWQHPDKGIHALSTRIISLVNSCMFPHKEMMETLKIMVLQQIVRYHEAHDLILQQDQQQLTYQTLLSDCQLLKTSTSSSKRLRKKDWLTSPPLQQQLPPFHPFTKTPSLPTLDVPGVATTIPRKNAQPTAKSAITAAACTTTQPCEENPRDLIAQSVVLEPNLPWTVPVNNHPEAVGAIPRPIPTDALDPAASANRAAFPAK